MSSGVQLVPREELSSWVGRELGPTDWFTMDQDKINRFADLTLDHQFIHVDPEKAAQTPFGGTIAHGFFTLSMLAHFTGQVGVAPQGIAMAVNYGLNKLRFLQPVRAGQRIRARVKPLSFDEKSPGQLLAANEVTVEIEGEDKPALVAEMLALYVLAG